ncbi:MAG: hypothetical protein A3G38_02160 [Omnitrophica WOR_2 bacterium RIFCSPLOWO2_12_FULL_51_8]|nr:MAG: hypothetical protein A3G38_02160 [Omnitrophica WOR_2 bacterium RIFCSPLOWO2_12_FULL_51_8]
MLPLRVVRKKIGELLLQRNVIALQQLNAALEEQKKKGGYLSQHLIALGFASELDIAHCLSNQYNFAYLPLKNYNIPREILALIPLKWIKIYTLLPVDKIGNVLSVAMADPLNEGVIQMLQQITECEIAVFVSTYTEINEAIGRYFEKELKELELYHIDAKDMEKVRNVSQFIQTKAYMGLDRREFIRIKKELCISFYYYAVTFEGRTKDISYGGVSFVSQDKNYGGVSFFSTVFMPLHTSLACKITLKPDKPPIDVVVNVLRVQSVTEEQGADAKNPPEKKYEIAGTFEFIGSEDKKALFAFLKENIV